VDAAASLLLLTPSKAENESDWGTFPGLPGFLIIKSWYFAQNSRGNNARDLSELYIWLYFCFQIHLDFTRYFQTVNQNTWNILLSQRLSREAPSSGRLLEEFPKYFQFTIFVTN
jgi:hypothetical protein